jgi:hypothetical protein
VYRGDTPGVGSVSGKTENVRGGVKVSLLLYKV